MRVSTRWWLGLVLLSIPAFLFVPGIGPLESAGPAALARRAGAHEVWYYRVEKGDVLSRIAEQELGTHVRYAEILRLNPGVKPRALLPGAVLKMPPRVAASGPAGGSSDGAIDEAGGPGSRDLLLSCAALLALLVLVIFTAGRIERRAT